MSTNRVPGPPKKKILPCVSPEQSKTQQFEIKHVQDAKQTREHEPSCVARHERNDEPSIEQWLPFVVFHETPPRERASRSSKTLSSTTRQSAVETI
jgi:hypothetical protein